MLIKSVKTLPSSIKVSDILGTYCFGDVHKRDVFQAGQPADHSGRLVSPSE